MHTRVIGVALSLLMVALFGACSDDDAGQILDAGPDVIDAEVIDASTLIPPGDYRMEMMANTWQNSSLGYSSNAFFDNFSNAIEGRRCAFSYTESCAIMECRRDEVTEGPVDYTGVSAGYVSVSYGTAPDINLILRPGSLYDMFDDTDSVPLWNPGDTITFTATGDIVPAFSEQLTFPTPLEVLSPTLDGTTLTIDRSTPLVVSWTPTSDVVRINLEQTISPTTFLDWNGQWITCDFPGGDGTGTMPSEVMELLEPSSTPGLNTTFAMGHGNYLERTPGGFPIRFSAFNLIIAMDFVLE